MIHNQRIGVGLAAIALTATANAQLNGNVLDAEWRYPDFSTVLEAHVVTVGPGIELPVASPILFLGATTANQSGVAFLSRTLPAEAQGGVVQAFDLSSCATSNVEVYEPLAGHEPARADVSQQPGPATPNLGR